MQRREFLAFVVESTTLGVSICCVTGCGTLFHAERCNQPHSNQIDWGVVALDGLGLILFFIPGIVAFAVDFGTGAIYLPPAPPYPLPVLIPISPPPHAVGEAIPRTQPSLQGTGLKCVTIPREQLQPRRIEQIVADHVGQDISLDDDRARLSKLSQIEQFDSQLNRHRSDSSFGQSVRSFFSQLQRA